MNTENKNGNADFLLRSALRHHETPDPELVQKVKYTIMKEEPALKKSTIRRSFGTAAAAFMMLLLVTTTAFAAWYFLKPSEVADRFENRALSAAFDSDTAVNINASLTSGDYTFTLLAIVTGRDITDYPYYNDEGILDDRTYSVVAIEKTDGSPMPTPLEDAYGNPSFYVSPYVKGLPPWQVNAHTMRGGHSETVVNGIMYRIIDCDEVVMFADRGVYLGINTGSFYNSQAFIFDEQTGALKANPNYDGSSVVFDLPLDKTLADPEKAAQYVSGLNAKSGAADSDEISDLWRDVDWDKAVPVASTVKEMMVDANGLLTYTFDFEYGSGTVSVPFDEHFGDNQTAQSVIISQMASDDALYAIRFSMDEGGTIRGMVIMPE